MMLTIFILFAVGYVLYKGMGKLNIKNNIRFKRLILYYLIIVFSYSQIHWVFWEVGQSYDRIGLSTSELIYEEAFFNQKLVVYKFDLDSLYNRYDDVLYDKNMDYDKRMGLFLTECRDFNEFVFNDNNIREVAKIFPGLYDVLDVDESQFDVTGQIDGGLDQIGSFNCLEGRNNIGYQIIIVNWSFQRFLHGLMFAHSYNKNNKGYLLFDTYINYFP